MHAHTDTHTHRPLRLVRLENMPMATDVIWLGPRFLNKREHIRKSMSCAC
jgi:hypothetical protein